MSRTRVIERTHRPRQLAYLDRMLRELQTGGAPEPPVVVLRDAEAMTHRVMDAGFADLPDARTVRFLMGVIPQSWELSGLDSSELESCWQRMEKVTETLGKPWSVSLEPTVWWVSQEVDDDGDVVRKAGVMLVVAGFKGLL